MSVRPHDYRRRSPIYRRLLAVGVSFRAWADVALAVSTPPDASAETLELEDLSVCPRWGLKGRGAIAWLIERGATVPSVDNRAAQLPDGTLIARLSPGEVLVLPPSFGAQSYLAGSIEQIAPSGEKECYPVPRRDSHCWFMLVGADAAKMLAKLCAVDLAADRFADGSVAQTSVARLSAIIVRNDVRGRLAFSLLADSASTEYFWDCLLDAMTEFHGAVVGADASRE